MSRGRPGAGTGILLQPGRRCTSRAPPGAPPAPVR